MRFGLPLLAVIGAIVMYLALSLTTTERVAPIAEADALQVATAFERAEGLVVDETRGSWCSPRIVHRQGKVRLDDASVECNLVLAGAVASCDKVWVVRGEDGRLLAERPAVGYIVCSTP